MYIAVAISTQPASAEQSYIGQLLDISSSADFYPRSVGDMEFKMCTYVIKQYNSLCKGPLCSPLHLTRHHIE